MPHIEFQNIKGKENILVDSLSRLRHLGLHEDNDPEGSDKNMASPFLTWMKTR